eukprot:6031906-Pyramimonas_sp.AAC.1
MTDQSDTVSTGIFSRRTRTSPTVAGTGSQVRTWLQQVAATTGVDMATTGVDMATTGCGHGYNRCGHGYDGCGHGYNRCGHGYDECGHGYNRCGLAKLVPESDSLRLIGAHTLETPWRPILVSARYWLGGVWSARKWSVSVFRPV